jgi:hypothetical protein
MGRIVCVVGAAFETLLSQRGLMIRAAQASSFVFGPAGIVLEKAIPQLRSWRSDCFQLSLLFSIGQTLQSCDEKCGSRQTDQASVRARYGPTFVSA